MSYTKKCKSCGKLWDKHNGIIQTCKKLEMAKSVLKTIYAWAHFRCGEQLKAKHVTKLIEKTLMEIE